MVDRIFSAPEISHQSALPRARARFLAQAIELEEEGVPGIVQASIYFIGMLFLSFIVWMALTQVNEVTVSRGEVIPAGYIHDIQHLEGGIVKDIWVRDGDQVNKGDLLISFSPPASTSEYEQLDTRRAALELELEQLLAAKNSREPDFGRLLTSHPDLTMKFMAGYKAGQASLESELNVSQARIKQRGSELRREINQVNALKKEVQLLQKQVDMRRELAVRSVVSKTDLLANESRLAEAESRLNSTKDNVVVARMALEEAKRRHQEIKASYLKSIENKISETAGRLAEVNKSLIKAKDQVNRLNLYAPVSGIVQGIAITTINAVVKPGATILKIVPVKGDLIVEARVSPEEIGYIHPEQPAEITIDSYDSAKFGAVKGKVLQISPSTYLDEKMNPYFRAKISMQQSFLGLNPQQFKIIPGMTVRVNIITGSKSILDYLLKPISRGFNNAFKER